VPFCLSSRSEFCHPAANFVIPQQILFVIPQRSGGICCRIASIPTEAKWKNLLPPLLVFSVLHLHLSAVALALFVCHSAAKRRNLLFAHFAPASTVIPTGAKRGGGICCSHERATKPPIATLSLM
jgi:hypothetical protein